MNIFPTSARYWPSYIKSTDFFGIFMSVSSTSEACNGGGWT